MINAPKAEGPATKEPEQSPSLPTGSPSGVVEAAMKVFGDFTYEALRHHKERSTKVKEFHAATNLIWDALRSLPKAPATRVDHIFTPGTNEAFCATCDVREDHHPQAPAPGSQGVEAPRKEARECWIVESKRETLVFWDKNKARCELQFYDADEDAEIIPMREVSEGGASGALCTLDDLYTAISERDEARAKVAELETEVGRLRKIDVIVSNPLFQKFIAEASKAMEAHR